MSLLALDPSNKLAALRTNAAGELLVAGGGSSDSSSSGDASAANQITTNDKLATLISNVLTRTVLLNGVTTTGAGTAVADSGKTPSFTVQVTGTGAVSATVLIQARNVASGAWITLATITLAGTDSAAEGFASLTRYMEYRANCTAIGGTVSAAMGA